MPGSSGRTVTSVIGRTLVAFQIAILLASLVGPAAVLAADPSADPSNDPSATPTAEPSATPEPTPEPTAEPSADPTAEPTVDPTVEPTAEPTAAPTLEPTVEPSAAPTTAPTAEPTPEPTVEPTHTSTPTVESDLADYAPGALVTLTGTGWQAGESVHLFINDDFGSTWNRSVTVTADAAGSIRDQFNLPDWFVAVYTVVATADSGTASTGFTDGRTVDSATLNGASTVTVAGGATITAVVNVATDNGGGNQNWRSTSWRIATTPPGTFTCFDNPNHDGSGSYSETFSVTAPATAGTYNAYFIAYSDNACSSQASAAMTLTNGVVVSRATTTVVTSGANPSTFGQSVTFTATVTATGGNPSGVGTVSFTADGSAVCTNVALSGNVATCATSSLTVLGSPHAIVAAYSGASGTPTFGASTSASLSQAVNKATSTTTVSCPASVTFTGSALTPCTVSVTGAGGLSLTPTPTYSNNTNAGTASANYSYAGDANHNGSSDSKSFTINQASSSTVVTCPSSVTYTGSALSPCTVSVTGAGGLSLSPTPTYSNNTSAGTAGAAYMFSGDANHTGSSDSKSFTIDKASSSTVVTCPASVTYTGAALTPCTVSVTGAGGLSLTPDPVHADNTDVGTASASYTYAGDGNHTVSSDSETFAIVKAGSTTVVSCPATVTYTGAALTPCTVSVTGAGGLSMTPTPTYSNNTEAGTASASYTYAGDANHTSSDDSKTFTIDKAGSTTVVSCPPSVTYTGSPLTPCTVSVTGPGGLSLTPDPVYADNTDAGIGTASASYSYAGDANHTGSDDSKNFTINKASSSTVVTCPASVTFDGTAQEPCTAKVTGAGGLDLVLTVGYDDNVHAGTATASATYGGDDNHLGSTGSATFSIDQAASVTVVSCPVSVVYDGTAQTPCTVSVTGAGALALSPDPTYSDNTNAGVATASYVFGGDADHTGSDDSTTFTIDKAPSVTTVTFETGPYVYRASAFLATANVSGAGGLLETLTVTYSGDCTNVTNADGCLASAAYGGDANHEPSDDSASIAITRALSTTDVSCPVSVVYDGTAHEPCTVSVTGIGDLDLSPEPDYANNTNAGVAAASYTYPGDQNHLSSFDSASFKIAKADSLVTIVCPSSQVYTGDPIEPCTASVTGAGGLSETLTVGYTDNVVVGTATASASYAGDANHFPDDDSVTFDITKAASSTVVTCPTNVTYTGSALTPCTVSVTGAGGLSLTPAATYANNTNAGTASASHTFAGDANHTGSSDSKTFTIDKASSTTIVTCPASITYTGSPLTPCTVSVTGAGGLSLTPAPSYSNNTNAGTASASYTYGGDANHIGSSDGKTFTIAKAGSTTVVTCPSTVPYTGSALMPCTVSVTGAGGLSLTPTPSYANNIVGLATASYTYAGDTNHSGSSGSTAFRIVFAWDGYLQPINDTAHQTGLAESKFKLGQTIPAKFVIKNAAGVVVQQSGAPTFSRSANLGICDMTLAPEAVPDLAPDTGAAFAWEGGQYHYNWSTKGLTSGEYRIFANLADGTARYVDICLTK